MEKRKRKISLVLLRRLRRFFVTTVLGGVVVVLPFTLFVLLLRLIFNFVTRLLSPVKQLLDFPEGVNRWIVDLISIGLIIGGFFLIGLAVRTNFGQRFWKNLEDRLLGPLPFYTILRDTVQQFFGRKKWPFTEVVSVDVFHNGTRMVGFITAELADDRYTVFIPTTPNPTNGFLFHVDKDQIEWLNARPEDAMRTIIGIGTGSEVLFQPKGSKRITEE